MQQIASDGNPHDSRLCQAIGVVEIEAVLWICYLQVHSFGAYVFWKEGTWGRHTGFLLWKKTIKQKKYVDARPSQVQAIWFYILKRFLHPRSLTARPWKNWPNPTRGKDRFFPMMTFFRGFGCENFTGVMGKKPGKKNGAFCCDSRPLKGGKGKGRGAKWGEEFYVTNLEKSQTWPQGGGKQNEPKNNLNETWSLAKILVRFRMISGFVSPFHVWFSKYDAHKKSPRIHHWIDRELLRWGNWRNPWCYF